MNHNFDLFLGCKALTGEDCIFPFAYNGIHNGCAYPNWLNNGIQRYCATSLKPNSSEGLTWGNCNSSTCGIGMLPILPILISLRTYIC